MVQESQLVKHVNFSDSRRIESQKALRRILNENGKIKNHSVGTLAKALTFVKVNEFIHIELLRKTIEDRDAALAERAKDADAYL